MNFNKSKNIEPFNLFGENSLIYSKQEAEGILKTNSYYIFFAAIFSFGIFVLLLFQPVDIGKSQTFILIFSLIYLFLGFAIRFAHSRLASMIALLCFGWAFLGKIIAFGFGSAFINLFFLAASYRCIKASFYYHKKTGEL